MTTNTNILITGANGFIGSAITKALSNEDFNCIEAGRKPGISPKSFLSLDLKSDRFERSIPSNINIVIHCAAAVHNSESDFDVIDKVNTNGTKLLIEAAIKAGVSHFIFLSSVAVYGLEHSSAPINAETTTCPKTPYGKSKLNAESLIVEKCACSNMDFTVIRLPIVYGSNAPGNFGKLLAMAKSVLPLPFGGIENKRTMVYVENLADFIKFICNEGTFKNKVLLFSDSINLGTSEILSNLRYEYGLGRRLFRLPRPLLSMFVQLFAGKRVYNQVAQDLIFVPSSEILQSEWKPKYSKAKSFQHLISEEKKRKNGLI